MSSWESKVVVVTGGSSGLGIAIARQFGLAGASVVCLARDADRLAGAQQRLKEESGVNVRTVVADVTSDQSVSEAIASIVAESGRIDCWVNSVGRSIRIKLADATMDDYRSLLEINFLSAVRCSTSVLPLLKESGGSLVQIGSLAAKTAWPLVSPYATSKHALAAYHHQLRLEGPLEVHYLFVCPGPIRRDDEEGRYTNSTTSASTGDGKRLPDSAAKPGAGVKLRGIDPDVLAARIVKACQRRSLEIVTPLKARLAFAIAQLSPAAGDWLLRKFSRRDS